MFTIGYKHNNTGHVAIMGINKDYIYTIELKLVTDSKYHPVTVYYDFTDIKQAKFYYNLLQIKYQYRIYDINIFTLKNI